MNRALGQYYTCEVISRLLIDQLRADRPRKILELGVGGGALLKAANERWTDFEFYGGDIDEGNVRTLKELFPETKLYIINGISSKLDSKIKLALGSVDVAICNPPYLSLKKNKRLSAIIKDSGLGDLKKYSRISSDLIFLAQNLNFLKQGGELGIIVPDGVVTSAKFTYFRNNLIKNHTVRSVIQLPNQVFKKTEAKTYILIVRKGGASDSEINLYKANHEAALIANAVCTQEEFVTRNDFEFHKWNSENKQFGKSLLELGVEVTRGRYSRKMLDELGGTYIHTSDLSNYFIELNSSSKLTSKDARAGDILVARVGSRCLGRVSMVSKGGAEISDCVFRLRVNSSVREKVFEELRSDKGKEWILAHSKGVCAQVLTKEDLLKFRVPV